MPTSVRLDGVFVRIRRFVTYTGTIKSLPASVAFQHSLSRFGSPRDPQSTMPEQDAQMAADMSVPLAKLNRLRNDPGIVPTTLMPGYPVVDVDCQ